MRNRLSAWQNVRNVLDDYRELDHERMFVLSSWVAHGKASVNSQTQTRELGLEPVHCGHDGLLSYHRR